MHPTRVSHLTDRHPSVNVGGIVAALPLCMFCAGVLSLFMVYFR
jgi:hypothetical protein